MSVETTLPHGLKTSVLTSAYKVEYDQNLTLLDNDRITVGDVSVRPAFGVARRFWFDPATKQLSYDDGTQWVEDLTKQSSLIVESLSTLNQDLTTDADVSFNSAILSSINIGTAIITGNINADALNAVGSLSITSPTSITLTVNSNDSIFIDSSGNVGIGTITPTAKLHIANGGGPLTTLSNPGVDAVIHSTLNTRLYLGSGSVSESAIYLGTHSSLPSGFIAYNSTLDKLDIGVGSNPGGIGTRIILSDQSSVGRTMLFSGDATTSLTVSNGGIDMDGIPIGTGNAIEISGTVLFQVASSRRYKNNITQLDFDPFKVLQFEASSFTWNGLTGVNGMRDFGFIVEQTDPILDAFSIREDGVLESFRYKLLSVAHNDILKAHDAEIDTLRQRIIALENK